MKAIQTNLIAAAAALIKLLKVKVTDTTLYKIVEQNPYYPSLFSLSDTFNRFNIPNQSFNLSAEQFQELDAPFIAFWKNDFVTVAQKNQNAITYFDLSGKNTTVPLKTFLKDYKNVVFVAEPGASSGEPEYENVSRKEKTESIKESLLIIATCLTMGLVLAQFYSTLNISGSNSILFIVLITATKLIGLSAVILLLSYEIDKSNFLTKNICSAGRQTSCEAVLNSKASRIMGISWSEIGYYYYATTTLFLFFPGTAPGFKTPYLAIASFLASPYVLFSVYYQWKIIKRWCPLCLIVQAALCIELLWALGAMKTVDLSPVVSASFLIAILISILLPFIFWNFLKPLFLKLKQSYGYEAAYKRLLYNPEIFGAMLHHQPQAPEGWKEIGITLGNPQASKTIVKVCNPFCGPCAKAHPILEKIIKQNPIYNLKVIFTSTNNPTDRGGIVARHLLAIAEKGDALKTQKALDDWYLAKRKDYEKFNIQNPLNGEVDKQKDKIEAMQKWCNDASITHTPTFFVDGKRLPEVYTIDDLKNIIQTQGEAENL